MPGFDMANNWGAPQPGMDYSSLSGYMGNATPPTGAQATGNWFSSLFGGSNPSTASLGGVGSGFGGIGSGSGLLGAGQLGIGAIGTLGNLWMAMQSQELAKQEFGFQKGLSTTNLDNSVKSYNTNLSDIANSRAVAENLSPAQTAAYLAQNKLTAGSIG